MKFISRYILPVLFALPVLVTGCAEGDIPESVTTDGSKEGMFSLTLNSGTRAFADGRPSESSEDPFNEFLIDNVYLFFYDVTADKLDENSATPIYSEHLSGLSSTTKKSLTVNIPLNKLSKDNLTNFCVYAVANISGDEKSRIDAIDLKTVASIKEVVIGSTFDYASVSVQRMFVMEGISGEIKQGAAANSAKGTIELERSAAKVTLNIKVDDSIKVTENGVEVEYQPVKTDVVAYFCNGVSESILVCDPTVGGFVPLNKYASSNIVKFGNTGKADYPLGVENPFYTYPNCWRGSVTNDNKSYMLLCVPWKKVGEQNSQENYYYQVPVNYEKADGSNKNTANVILRNNHYVVNVKVGKLGSTNKDIPDDVEEENLDYMIMDWSTETINVSLDKLRYLQVERNSYEMKNTTDLSIPFVTSHDVEIVDACLNFKEYKTSNGTPEDYYVLTGTQVENKDKSNSYLSDEIYSVLIEGNNIKFHHGLNRITTGSQIGTKQDSVWVEEKREWSFKEFAFVTIPAHWEVKEVPIYGASEDKNQQAIGPFELTLTIRHKDEPTVLQKITITQYPPLYIEVFDSPTNNNGKSAHVFINGGNGDLGGNYQNSGGSGNQNYNNYVINVTRFDTSNTSYIIGDPRTKENSLGNAPFNSVNGNNGYDWSANGSNYKEGCLLTDGKVSSTSNHRLSVYYKTETNAAYANYIAPIIRVASSRGATSGLSYDNAQRRCATYQENGRPAGRWRVPTYGEVKFITELTSKNLIPALFTKGSSYWISQGRVTIPDSGDLNEYDESTSLSGNYNNGPYVRCVYDDWYWNDVIPEGDRNIFTWGDRERSN